MREIEGEARRLGALFQVQTQKSKPIRSLDKNLQSVLEQSAKKLGIPIIYLPSGPAHDAMNAAQAGIPTAMLFVQSKGGISHNPKEYTPTNYIANAAQILADCLANRQF